MSRKRLGQAQGLDMQDNASKIGANTVTDNEHVREGERGRQRLCPYYAHIRAACQAMPVRHTYKDMQWHNISQGMARDNDMTGHKEKGQERQ